MQGERGTDRPPIHGHVLSFLTHSCWLFLLSLSRTPHLAICPEESVASLPGVSSVWSHLLSTSCELPKIASLLMVHEQIHDKIPTNWFVGILCTLGKLLCDRSCQCTLGDPRNSAFPQGSWLSVHRRKTGSRGLSH